MWIGPLVPTRHLDHVLPVLFPHEWPEKEFKVSRLSMLIFRLSHSLLASALYLTH